MRSIAVVLSAVCVAAVFAAGCGYSDDDTGPDADTDADSDADADASADTDTDADTDIDSDSDTDTDTDTDGCGEPDCDAPCVRYVATTGTGTACGLAWTDAFSRPQDGVDAASEAATACGTTCQVWVAAGTYSVFEGDASDTLQLRPGVELLGGFAGTETAVEERDWAAHVVALDGGHAVYHVVRGAESAVIDGVTVQHGGFTDEYAESAASSGGGMINNGVSVTVRNCTFASNLGTRGGGMFNYGSSVLIEDSRFQVNKGMNTGGALSNCDGSTVSIARSVFAGNWVEDAEMMSGKNGAAVHSDWSSTTIADSLFVGNEAYDDFGGLSILWPSGGDLVIVNCTFTGNSVGDSDGATLRCDSEYTMCSVRNSVFFGNDAPLDLSLSTASTASYSLVEGGYAGDGNVDADPLFVDAGVGDFRLSPGSPCIDAADGDAAPEFDIEGNARFDDPDTADTGVGAITYADMGAYEYQGE